MNTNEAVEAAALEAARTALFKVNANARTGVTNPVNGSAAYSWVTFCGEVKTFHDGEFTLQLHRDAGSAKAGEYAQRINDTLFAVAKEAAQAALAAALAAARPIIMQEAAGMVQARYDKAPWNAMGDQFKAAIEDLRTAAKTDGAAHDR